MCSSCILPLSTQTNKHTDTHTCILQKIPDEALLTLKRNSVASFMFYVASRITRQVQTHRKVGLRDLIIYSVVKIYNLLTDLYNLYRPTLLLTFL